MAGLVEAILGVPTRAGRSADELAHGVRPAAAGANAIGPAACFAASSHDAFCQPRLRRAVKRGDRVAQLILERIATPEVRTSSYCWYESSEFV